MISNCQRLQHYIIVNVDAYLANQYETLIDVYFTPHSLKGCVAVSDQVINLIMCFFSFSTCIFVHLRS